MEELRAWLLCRGINLEPILDDKVHRFSLEGKSDKSGWYIGSNCLYPNGKNITTFTLGDWSTDSKEYFRSGKGFENGDYEKHERLIRGRSTAIQEEKEKGWEEAASRAEKLWAESLECHEHEYLRRKGFVDQGSYRQFGLRASTEGALLIPMRDEAGKLWGLQRIYPDGTKRFLSGQRTGGCFHVLHGANRGVVAICEGFATGLSIHQATGYTIYVAFNAGNLRRIAESAKSLNAGVGIIVCGDDDKWKDKNVGREKATEAAKSVGGVAVFPEFGTARSTVNGILNLKPTDWNDLMGLGGINEVRRQIEGALNKKEDENLSELSEYFLSQKEESKEIIKIETKLDRYQREIVFPDTTEKGRIKCTVENLKALLNGLGIICRYNVVSKKEEILIPGKTFTLDNQDNCSISEIFSKCKLYNVPTDGLVEFLSQIADENVCNPVVTWIESKKWDGVSRLQSLCDTIKSTSVFKDILIKKWLISAIAAAFNPNGVSAHGVLVFRGNQYIGKTRWFNKLAPEELGVLKDGATLHPDNKDSVLGVIPYWLVELGELDATFKKSDIAQLKAFLTKNSDAIRRPYGRKESHYARRTVFFASVNEKCFLNDSTGNRRFWTVECESIDHEHQIDMQQLWAEIYEYYKAGESWLLTKSENEALNETNEEFQTMDPIEEMIRVQFRWNEEFNLSWLTATEVCNKIGMSQPGQQQTRKAASALRKLIKQSAKTIHGTVRFPVPEQIKPTFL